MMEAKQFDRHSDDYADVRNEYLMAMEKMDNLNHQMVMSFQKMKMEHCPTLTPVDNNPIRGCVLMYGTDKINRYDGLPSRFTVLEDIEKHIKQKIYYY